MHGCSPQEETEARLAKHIEMRWRRTAVIRVGHLMLESERYREARQHFERALEATAVWDVELLTGAATSYVEDQQFELAEETFARAFDHMPPRHRILYEDITTIASPQDIETFRSLSQNARQVRQRERFLRTFWLQNDPTPATEINERKLEHYRRVWYATTYFSRRKPWDDRGTVYVRYGKPTQRATSRNAHFTIDRDVYMLRDRLYAQIYGSRGGGGAPMDRPAYPIDRARMGIGWEEWVYAHVGTGLVILFTDKRGGGVYTFATPPSGGSGANFATLMALAPEVQYVSARQTVPDRYVYSETQAPLDFQYYLAQFRADADTTEIDVFYGLPMDELEFREDMETGSFAATIERGYAMFDSAWNIVDRTSDRIELHTDSRPQPERGQIHVDRQTMRAPGGRRILLSVQTKDVTTGRLQAYKENVQVRRFDRTTLSMSDIVMAADISLRRTQETTSETFVRNGLHIVPMSSLVFSRSRNPYVYLEIYNLTRGTEFGDTEYEVEHAIRDDGGGGILSAMGRVLRTRQQVGVGRMMKGHRSDETEHFRFDTSTLGPGSYTLIITVRDVKGNATISRERSFRIDR